MEYILDPTTLISYYPMHFLGRPYPYLSVFTSFNLIHLPVHPLNIFALQQL